MKIHEYQARQILADAGIPVPSGQMIESIEAAAPAYKRAVAEAGLGDKGLVVDRKSVV